MDNPEVEELYNEADEHYENQNYSDAEICYKAALKLAPDNFEILFSLGALYHSMEMYKKSIKYSKKAFVLEPENARVCFNIGLAYDMQGNYKKSIEYFTNAVELDPEYALAFFARGNTRMEQQLYEDAIEDYEQAIFQELPFLTVWTNLASCLREAGRYQDALDTYLSYDKILAETPEAEQKFTVEPSTDEIALGKGICCYMLGNDKEAARYLLQVTDTEEDKLAALAYLIAIDSFNGRPDGIKHSITQLEDASPGYTTRPTGLLKCPHTRFLFLGEQTAEVPEYKGSLWSDGRVEGLLSQALPFITWCPACRSFHPVEDLLPVHDVPNRMYGAELMHLEWDDVQNEEYYLKALEQSWPEDLEKQLRIRLLWKQNDNHRENPPVEASNYYEHHENLERLLDLVPHETAPVRLAEFYRELGDFAKCIKILDSLPFDPKRSFIIEGIRASAEKRIIAPVYLEKEKIEITKLPEETPFERRRDQGFDPHPVTEDIFAFPYAGKDEEYRPLLSVKMSMINPDWKGWASFLYKDDSFHFHYDRMFSEYEWADFQKLDKEWQEDLIWFWSYKSWRLPEDEDALDEYYRILYQLYYGCDYSDYLYTCYNNFLAIDLEMLKDDFSEIWKGIEADLTAMGDKYLEWIKHERSRIYWDFCWQFYSNDFEVPDRDKLAELYKMEKDYKRNLEEGRREAMSGLKYVEIGGGPSWFQGQNKTPEGGEFIGQLWSDYMNIGSKLLYLFYDPVRQMLQESYDYD